SANREGSGLLPFPVGERILFPDLVPARQTGSVRFFLESVLTARTVRQLEEDMPCGAESRTLRFTAAPLRAPGGDRGHALVLVEDITLHKRVERQMLLTERLTTAGRLASGVAH